MKLRNLFVFPILASLMLIGGCKKTAPVEPVDPTPVEPSEPEEPVVAKTVEEVAADFGASISAAVGATVTLADKGTYFGVTLNFSEDGVDYSNTQAEESVLAPVASTLVNLAPEYLTVVGAKYFTAEEDFWEDGSGDTAYYAALSVDEVGVDIISYCYSGYLLGQIAVYANTAE